MTCNRFITFRRIAAFHSTGNPDKFLNISLPLVRSHLIITPVIDNSSDHKHSAACSGQIIFSRKISFFKSIQHFYNCYPCFGFVVIDKILKRVQLYSHCHPTHLGIITKTSVFLCGFFSRSPVKTNLIHCRKYFLSFYSKHFCLKGRYFISPDV